MVDFSLPIPLDVNKQYEVVLVVAYLWTSCQNMAHAINTLDFEIAVGEVGATMHTTNGWIRLIISTTKLI